MERERDLTARVERVLDRTVRPWLARHGGDVEVLDVEGGTVRVRMTGGCAGCPTADAELSEVVAAQLHEQLPEVRRVVPVAGVSDALLAQARNLLALHVVRHPAGPTAA